MAAMDLTQVDLAMDEYWKNHPAKAQFHRVGNTARWFRPRGEVFRGKRFNFKAFTQSMSNVRTSDFATAAGIDYEYPVGRQLLYTELSYDRADMTFFAGSMEINEIAEEVTTDQRHAVYSLMRKMFREANLEFGRKFNLAIHQDTAAKMGTVAAIYTAAGGSYSSSRYAFLQITDVQISKFTKGDVLDIGGESDVLVMDVIPGTSGPWSSAARVADIGPGIVVDYGSGNTADSSVDDDITHSGETTGDGMAGFDAWFSGGTNVYNDADGSAINRDASGNAWSIPIIEHVADEGSEVVIDLDAHVGLLADYWPQAVSSGRLSRQGESVEDNLMLPGTLVGICTPEMCNSIVTEGEATARFTKAMDMSKDNKQQLFAQVSFEGLVYHTPTLPAISFQADLAAPKHKIRFLDPQSWGYLTLNEGGGMYGISWLKSGGGVGTRWMRVIGSNKRMTNRLAAAAKSAMLLYCDQPRANAEITGVKSHRAV